MKRPFWKYTAAGCNLFITPRADGRFNLVINDDLAGTYLSAQAAADDVFTCTTGNHAWDKQGTVFHPTDLSEWQRI